MLDGKGWIVPCLLSEEECEQLITLGEEFGIHGCATQIRDTDEHKHEHIGDILDAEVILDLECQVEIAFEQTARAEGSSSASRRTA